PPEPLTKSNDTLAEEIVEFMRDAWNLHVPNLIISVTGGAKYFIETLGFSLFDP
ncbi:unnamed protein product, partial [Didymodactylos carnosus]